MPKLSKRYFLIDTQHAFIPTEKAGIFIMVHPCVIFVDCSYCNAKAGQQCQGRDGRTWTTSSHWMRREDGVKLVKEAVQARKMLGKLPL